MIKLYQKLLDAAKKVTTTNGENIEYLDELTHAIDAVESAQEALKLEKLMRENMYQAISSIQEREDSILSRYLKKY